MQFADPKVRLEASIRALELELGLREWDRRDELEARERFIAENMRYYEWSEVTEYVEQERCRLSGPSTPPAT